MIKGFKKSQPVALSSGWRQYQQRLKKAEIRRNVRRTVFRLALFVLIPAVGIGGAVSLFDEIPFPDPTSSVGTSAAGPPSTAEKQSAGIDRSTVRRLVEHKPILNLREERFVLKVKGRDLSFNTSLDGRLQAFLLQKLDRRYARRIGIVVLEPLSGRILAMAGFDEDEADARYNPCTDNRYPAASVFKIVTAAAAAESAGLTSDSMLQYNGRKHTLYKSQLKKTDNRYTNHIRFKDAFAQSINPVFGKLGVHYLGKSALQAYAEAFGFNQRFDLEFACAPSRLAVSEEPYHRAEIASGFNNETTLSPLHGVLIAAAVLNQGLLVAPTIVDSIADEDGRVVYRGRAQPLGQAVSPATSAILYQLMQTTIRSGTCRRTFRGYLRHPVLSKLSIGGKTGSIDNREHDTRFDWFVGFAEDKQGSAKIAVAVLVAHGRYLGTRASQYARLIMENHFRNHFTRAGQHEKADEAG